MSEDLQRAARENLRRELRDLCFILTRKTWIEELPFKVYDVVMGATAAFDGKPLANPLLAHFDALSELSEQAGGWFLADDAEAFVELGDWDARYAEWKAKK